MCLIDGWQTSRAELSEEDKEVQRDKGVENDSQSTSEDTNIYGWNAHIKVAHPSY